MSQLHVSSLHFSLRLQALPSHIALQQERAARPGVGVVMAVLLDIAKRQYITCAKRVQTQPASLVGRMIDALRRGADQRFTEQLERIERTGRAGAF